MQKIKSYLGFAKKSGNVCFGIDKAISKKTKLIVYSSQLAENSVKKIQKSGIDAIMINSNQYKELGESALVIGITDKNLASAIQNSIKEGV